MNPLPIIFGVIVFVASACSLADGGVKRPHFSMPTLTAADKAQSQDDWDAARNLRPCFGTHDPACKYPVKGEVR